MMKKIIAFALGALCLLAAGSANADVFGRLRVVVRVQPSSAPSTTCRFEVTLQDAAGVRGDITLTTGKDGTVLSPPLESHAWKIVRVRPVRSRDSVVRLSLSLDALSNSQRQTEVAPDTTTDVTMLLDSTQSKVIAVTGDAGAQAALVYRRDQTFIRKYPVTAGNPQSLGRVLRTVPGVPK